MDRKRQSLQNNGYSRRYVRPVKSLQQSQDTSPTSNDQNLPISQDSSQTQQVKKPKKRKRKLISKKQKQPKKRRMMINGNGLFVWRPPVVIQRIMFFCQRHRLFTRVICAITVVVLLWGIFYWAFQERFKDLQYKISPKADALIVSKNDQLATKLTYDQKQQMYEYNKGYVPSGENSAGQTSAPKFTAKFNQDPTKGIELTDPTYQVSFTMKPKFKLNQPLKDGNRLIYPLAGKEGAKVISLRSIGYKEDIVLEKSYGDKLDFSYELALPESLEARLEKDGSLAIYGSDNTALMGNVSAGTDKDAELLKNARKNSSKTKLVFRMPAPYIKETNNRKIVKQARFDLNGNVLTLKADNLKDLNYPISIDPTVYIETASKLMRGNNETNTDFDIDDELIQKSQTTGARIDAWEDNLDFNNGTWDQGVAAAGGYIYRSGGRTDPSKPSVVSTTQTLRGTDGSPFALDMPAERPAGDLYIAVMCHDGSDGGAVSAPSGWTAIADAQGFIAYYKVGTDQGGGQESANYSWTGYGNEEWAGAVIRVTNFDSADPLSGTPGTGSSGSNSGRPVFPATTPDAASTLVVRAAGWDQDNPSTTGWLPTGHTKLGSSSSSGGGNGSCGYAAASLDSSPASGVSTGTATFADASATDDYGAMSIAINPKSVTPGTEDTIQWAKFNSTTLAIESPNPGTGACSGWCSNSSYDLPEARRGHSMVAYNGYMYVIGGTDGTNRESTVFIAKLGANGEPQLWHPTGGTPAYWYSDTGLNGGTARSYLSAVAYNNRMYVLGGQTNASSGGVTTVEYAEIRPNGTLGSWSSGTALPSARHMQSVQVYNDTMYLIGGNSSGTLQSTVYYNKINGTTGALNSWVQTASFTTARSSFGGNFTAVWGAYVYLSGGCTALSSGYCSTVADDTQIASLNADGTISEWSTISGLLNQRIGYSIIGWQNGLYRLGGCTLQNTGTGACDNALADVDYGTVNPAGEVSTVSISVASGSGSCAGGSPYDCDLPPPGDDAGEGGQMLSQTVILNGYLYVIGGCIDYDCNGTDPAGDDSDVTGNTSYVSINSNGRLSKPATCSGTSYGAWCVDSTNRINGTTGIAAGGVTVFNNRVYIVGGLTGSGISTNIYYNDFNSDGSINGAWQSVDMTTAGIAEDVAYTYVFSRANPASAGSNPGNLYLLGGCGNNSGGAGCGGSDYETEVYKCNIATGGSVSGCTTTGQLQIDAELADETNQGLGIHSGTVYANYVYLVGGYSPNVADRDTVFYAKIDNSNNIVDAESGLVSGDDDDWLLSTSVLSVGRRRGWSFSYNGHIYSVGGYDDSGTGIIPFIEWAKMNVSDGSVDPFITSSVTINQRWGLSMVVSNSYAYVIGGCDVGASPGSCSSFEASIQTFQLYNNDSGAVNDFTAQSDQDFATDANRIGAASTVYNGYLYVAGGCTDIGCTTLTDNVQYAKLNDNDGTVETWNNTSDSTLPASVAWGSLEVAGGRLYYVGGQDSSADEKSAVYYGSPSSGDVATWATATNGLPADRTQFGSAVWNNRLYVVGGLDDSGAVTSTVYVSPQLNSGGSGDISSAWSTASSSFNVARSGVAVTAYANNIYLFGGYDGSNYLSDGQFATIGYKTGTISQSGTTVTGNGTSWTSAMVGSIIQYPDGSSATITGYTNATTITVNASKSVSAGTLYTIQDGQVYSWTYTNSLPSVIRDARAVSENGYIYLVGGRTAASTCSPKVMVAPVSANTTIVTGNNPTGTGEWYETNTRYTGDRYGAAVAMSRGKIYTMGGGCSSVLSSNRHYYSSVKSQPQVAIYSRMIDTDTDVFPNSWLMNGVDNSIGARWQAKYRTMHDISDSQQNPNEDCGTSATMPVMTSWGQETNSGDITLGDVMTYTPKESSGGNINCARYFYFYVSIDASKTFGYPEDVSRGPTITDLSLFFTSDPSKRLRHGKTFTGGEQQPLDTPCRQSNDAQCPLP